MVAVALPQQYTPPAQGDLVRLFEIERLILACGKGDALRVENLFSEMERLDPGGPRGCDVIARVAELAQGA